MNNVMILEHTARRVVTDDMNADESTKVEVGFDFENEDRWPVEVLGLKPNYSHSFYYLLFSRIEVAWLKPVVKTFIRLQAATKSLASCQSYITGLAHFDAFLRTLVFLPDVHQINRQLIVQYLSYLSTTLLSVASKQMALVHFRTFHQRVVQEDWLPWPERQLVYTTDIPKSHKSIPKFIPESVVMQLEKHLVHLTQRVQYASIILLETGRRITEITSLPFHCLEKDAEDDWFLKVKETKLKRSYFLPISKKCYEVITKQQRRVLDNEKILCKDYLFPSLCNGAKTKHINSRTINRELNKLAIKYKIVDENNQTWHFHSHQFRHTIGTRMINAGVAQVMVQKYLGHESPEMTARYAHIHDQTLKEAFNQYQGKLVDVQGELRALDDEYQNALWLKKNIMSQVLPNGLCTLPIQQQRCPHANACLTCSSFRTNKQHLSQHKEQLKQTECFIEQAQSKGFTRQVEMNQKVKVNLEVIITRLETSDEK